MRRERWGELERLYSVKHLLVLSGLVPELNKNRYNWHRKSISGVQALCGLQATRLRHKETDADSLTSLSEHQNSHVGPEVREYVCDLKP